MNIFILCDDTAEMRFSTLNPLKKNICNIWWHSMQFFYKSKMFRPIRGQGWPSWNSNHSKNKQHFFRTPRGRFMASLVTSDEVLLENKVKNVSANERQGRSCWILHHIEKQQYFSRSSERTILASLPTSHALVLEKKLKISWPIRGQDSHLGFLISSKGYNTSSGPLEE